jgi:phosphate transport system permease protein
MTTLAVHAPLRSGVSWSRRVKNRAFLILLWVAGGLALLPLCFIASYVIAKGARALNVDFFTKAPVPPPLTGGGFGPAFVGTMMMVGMAALFAIPLGVLAAVYLSEYGRGRVASGVRFVSEILLSTPSIIAGAFIWALVVVALGAFSAFAGALALTVIMWPIIARTTEEVLRLVPQELREAGLALGLPRWKVILRVVVPTAGAGIFTAVMLAVARGLGETAPVLLTALGNQFYNTNPGQPTDAVTLRIYGYAQSAFPAQHDQAWGGAIVLLAAVLLLSVTARILSVRQQRRSR